MKTILRLWRLVVLVGAALLEGCASTPQKPQVYATPVQESAPAQPPATRPALSDLLSQSATQPSAPFEGEGWQALDDGKTLAGWRATDFAGHGEVRRESGLIVLEPGDPLTGISGTNPVPNMNYEIALDAMRVSGSDFFCGLTVPVRDSFCSLIVGGWGGSLVGISSLDGLDASENETTSFTDFSPRRWYRIRLRVTENKIQAWIGKEKVVDVVTTDRRISLRPGDIELSKPFGIAAYETTAALRQIKMRRVGTD